MTLPDTARVCGAIDATWPAVQEMPVGPWIIRRGAGGGNRVSAARIAGHVLGRDVAPAADAMRALGQRPLFSIRPGDAAADAVLADAGYVVQDETAIFAAPVGDIATVRPLPATVFAVWPPLALQREIWTAGGIGAARLAVMDRVTGPKTTLLGRVGDTPAGCLFVALHGGIAMLHAMEVSPAARRLGLGRDMTRAAAFWAADQGATTFTLLATCANTAAQALYRGLGMRDIGHYHYRALPKD